jgi:hypothetical protein
VATDLARTRTHVSFDVPDAWTVIATWAREHRFVPRTPQSDTVKLFQRGTGFLTAPMKVQFEVRGTHVDAQAWVHMPLVTRIMSLFLLPTEMPVESGGFKAIVPRNMLRKLLNVLLAKVGAPLVQ